MIIMLQGILGMSINDDNQRAINPYQPPAEGTPALEPLFLGPPHMIRAAFAQDEKKLKCCLILYIIAGTIAAVPAIGAVTGAVIMLTTPSLSQHRDYHLQILAVGIVLSIVSLAYYWTALGLYQLTPFATRLGIALILPILAFAPFGTLAGWLALNQLTSHSTNLIVTKEYRSIVRCTAIPHERLSLSFIGLVASQVMVAVQILVLCIFAASR
jgi:hypothetical protein